MLTPYLDALKPHVPMIALLVSFSALAVSVTAAGIAWRNYRRKSSTKIRGFFSLRYSVDCDDPYVSSVVIENLKDRAVTIFGLYLRVGHNYFIKIEDFTERPLILRAYETWSNTYGPIEYYVVSSAQIAMRPLLSDKQAKQALIVSTSSGKYVVKEPPRPWSPLREFFRNHMTAFVTAQRGVYEGKEVGGNVPFIVKITAAGGESQAIQINRHDYQVQRFRNFRLTQASLISAENLRAYLQLQVDQGNLVCESFKVLDIETWRNEARSASLGSREFKARYVGWCRYNVIGRFNTWRRDRLQKKRNKKQAAMRPMPVDQDA